jgi:GNAT superfamily N-acetyltransferase
VVLEHARAHLAGDPVRHNLVLTVLENRAAHPEPGRYWVVADDERTVGVALQSPLTFAATCTPMAADAVAAAVDAIAAADVALPGLVGDALTAARFAGQWTERTGTAAWPIQGQRLYEVDRVVPARPTGGRARVADVDDLALVTEWFEAFADEIGEHRDDVGPLVARRVESGQVWLWEDGSPVGFAALSAPVEGVSRIGPVYTPPERRGRGYGSALVATVSAAVRAAGTRCALYAELGNPSANAIYRSLGYRAVAEVLRYRFGDVAAGSS